MISEQIRQQIFYASLLQNIETNIKSSVLMKALKQWIQQQCALAIFCIPVLFGGNAIWIALFVAETVTLVLATVLSKTNKLVYR